LLFEYRAEQNVKSAQRQVGRKKFSTESTQETVVPESIRHPRDEDIDSVLPGNFEYLGAIRPPHI